MTSDMQFAFKGEHGTATCTLMLKEIAGYYNRKGSDAFSAFIDASKDFDRVRHDMLFPLLIDRGLPVISLRL